MNGKKLIVSISVIMVVAIIAMLSLSACSESAKLTDIFADGYKYGQEYSLSAHTADGLSGCSDCVVNADGFVTARRGDSNVLYNIDTDRTIVTTGNRISMVFSGLYSVVDDSSVAFYGKNGFITRAEYGQYTVRSSEVVFSDGRVLRVNAKGEPYYVGSEKAQAEICVGDYYIEPTDDGNIYVYDNNKKLIKYINSAVLLNAPDDSIITVVALKNKLAFQVLTQVTDEDADYDFITEDVKYIYRSYIYDIKKAKLSAQDTPYVLRSNLIGSNAKYNYALVFGFKINEDKCLSPIKICVFNDKLEEVIDLDDYLQGAIGIVRYDENTTVIYNDDVAAFYRGKKFDCMYKRDEIDFTSSGHMRLQNKFVDSNFNELLDMFGREQLFRYLPTDKRIYYAVDGAMFVYNKQGETVKLGDEYAVYGSCYTITEVTGAISMYHSYNGKAIFMNKHYTSVSTYYKGEYGLIAALNEDGVTQYYAYRLASQD
ncbi:MAG: hypothetical protein K2M44_00285 [Clostridia bacterium]|nr:hypothetical protein [Clostridia bacterium]